MDEVLNNEWKVPGGQGGNGVKYGEHPTCQGIEAKQNMVFPRWFHSSLV